MSEDEPAAKGAARPIHDPGGPVPLINPRVDLRPGQTIAFEGVAIGEVLEGAGGEPWLFLDLGWLRAAGLHFSILGDRVLDHRHKIIER